MRSTFFNSFSASTVLRSQSSAVGPTTTLSISFYAYRQFEHISHSMILSELLEELVLDIADFLDTEKNVLVFTQLSRHFHNTLISYIYRRNAKSSGGSALLWAAEHG